MGSEDKQPIGEETWIVLGKILRNIFSLLALTAATRAGFRCTFGNWACTAGCVALGQTSGLCDDAGVCHCSAKSISLSNFRAMLPSRCTLGESFCQGTCHSLGRASGTCGTYGCTCSDRYLTPSEFSSVLQNQPVGSTARQKAMQLVSVMGG